MESPIDLYDDIIKMVDIEPFVIEQFNKRLYSEVVNTGEGIVISVSPQNSPIIKGGGLPYPEYLVFQMHFRWDSEHAINKERYPMEVQIITIAKECHNYDIALAKKGVAIFSVLYNWSHQDNIGLEELLPIIPFISDEIDKPVPFEVLQLSHFFPQNWKQFYRYTGSLTFPPYTSGVIWTIFKEEQPITRPQMGMLCDIQDPYGNLIVYNNSASRSVKTVLFTTGVVKVKCACPRKMKTPKSTEKWKDEHEVREEQLGSKRYNLQEALPEISGEDQKLSFKGQEEKKKLELEKAIEGQMSEKKNRAKQVELVHPEEDKNDRSAPKERRKYSDEEEDTTSGNIKLSIKESSPPRSNELIPNQGKEHGEDKRISGTVSFQLIPLFHPSENEEGSYISTYINVNDSKTEKSSETINYNK